MQQLYLPKACHQCTRLDRNLKAHHLQRDGSTISYARADRLCSHLSVSPLV